MGAKRNNLYGTNDVFHLTAFPPTNPPPLQFASSPLIFKDCHGQESPVKRFKIWSRVGERKG